MNNKIVLKPGQRIRTLGLYQPYATLMLHGKIETRIVGSVVDKKTRKRKWRKPPFPFGKYLIYATLKSYDFFDVQRISAKDADRIHVLEASDDWATYHLRGVAICVGDLVEIIDPITPDTKNTFVDYLEPTEDERRVGLVFQNVERIVPFPIKGKQGIGFVESADINKIEIIF